MTRSLQALRLPKVLAKTGLSRSHTLRLVKQGKFPAPTHLSERLVVWFEHQIDEWLESRINNQNEGDDQ